MEPASNPLTAERFGAGSSEVPGANSHPWDGYLTGPENELAMAAAQAMARGERDGISPFVVHGPSGVGKSRLLAGLVTERLRRQPGSTVAHLDAEAFVMACNEAAAVPGGVGWPALRGRFRSVDLFVLEDFEGLERGPLAREELVYTLDALESAGASVAVSARSAPGTWPSQAWPRRLVNRLLGGLAAPIAPPGLTSRRRYVLQRSGEHGVALEAEAVETLAEAGDGYRTLAGWISRLALEVHLKREPGGLSDSQRSRRVGSRPLAGAHPRTAPFDAETVALILAEDTLLAGPVVTIDAIAQRVAEQFRVRLSVMRGPSRRASVVEARHVAMYLARTFSGSSFAVIGRYFGGRDPASVRHACKAAALRLENDQALAAAVANLSRVWQR